MNISDFTSRESSFTRKRFITLHDIRSATAFGYCCTSVIVTQKVNNVLLWSARDRRLMTLWYCFGNRFLLQCARNRCKHCSGHTQTYLTVSGTRLEFLPYVIFLVFFLLCFLSRRNYYYIFFSRIRASLKKNINTKLCTFFYVSIRSRTTT